MYQNNVPEKVAWRQDGRNEVFDLWCFLPQNGPLYGPLRGRKRPPPAPSREPDRSQWAVRGPPMSAKERCLSWVKTGNGGNRPFCTLDRSKCGYSTYISVLLTRNSLSMVVGKAPHNACARMSECAGPSGTAAFRCPTTHSQKEGAHGPREGPPPRGGPKTAAQRENPFRPPRPKRPKNSTKRAAFNLSNRAY